MKEPPFEIERTYNAPVALVWKAISNKDEMKKWYFDFAEFKPVSGFEFEFKGGSENVTYIHHCKITEVIEFKKLAYSWAYEGYEGYSVVTFELFPEGNATRVKLTHEGLETFPRDNPDFAKKSFVAGWNQIIGESLKKYLEETN